MMTQLILKGFFLFCDPVLKVAFFPSERVFFSTPIYFSKGSITYSLEFFFLCWLVKNEILTLVIFFSNKSIADPLIIAENQKRWFFLNRILGVQIVFSLRDPKKCQIPYLEKS